MDRLKRTRRRGAGVPSGPVVRRRAAVAVEGSRMRSAGMQATRDRIPDARNIVQMNRTPRMLPMSGPMAMPVSSPA